jgi:hypothetical protein
MGQTVTDVILTGLLALYITAVVVALWKAFTDD